MSKIKQEYEHAQPSWFWMAFIILLLLGASLRIYELDRAPFRSDEVNQYSVVVRGQGLKELWKNPPWLNQIPVVESVALVTAPLLPKPPNEFTIRLPFAVFGIATLLVSAIATLKFWGVKPALLLLLWMSLNPFHLYESREAYNYVLVMFFGAGSVFAWLKLHRTVIDRSELSAKTLWPWAVWLVLGCHVHMSFWIFATVQWLILLWNVWRLIPSPLRKKHLLRLLSLAGIVGIVMSRWIFRAIKEIVTVTERGGHIGDPLEWVLPRVLPIFLAGANWVGGFLIIVLALAMLLVLRPLWNRDLLFRALTLLLGGGLGAALLYVGFLGGGAAKTTYFSSYWPLLLIWSSVIIVRFCEFIDSKHPRFGSFFLAALALFIGSTLAAPAWHIIHLDGKPTPYKIIQAELDRILAPGSVLVVDRWFEPWNEMAVHAPTNVFVTFTVPDEPYDAYVRNRWRDVTRHYIENDRAQAFLMMTRNHWEREGIWQWPAQHFTRHTSIRNESGLWLRERGFAPIGDFYGAQTNRLVAELYYDLPEDRVERARQRGLSGHVQFGPEWGYTKPWQQTGDFVSDYRVMGQVATLHVFNLGSSERLFQLTLQGAALPGTKTIRLNETDVLRFPGQQLVERALQINLKPGKTVLKLRDVQPASTGQLYIADIELQLVPEQQ